MITISEVTGVVFKTGSNSACMNTTSEVKSAVSVVHRLFEDSSYPSLNPNGNGDVTPLGKGDVVTVEEMDGSKSWERFYNSCPLWGYPFGETQDTNAEWPHGLRWEMGRFFSGETVYPIVFAETFHPENSCLSRKRR